MPGRDKVRVDCCVGQGDPAVLMHANGFVPRAYTPFLEALGAQLRVEAIATRGQLGFEAPARGFGFRAGRGLGWQDIGHDLGQWLRKNKSQPVVGIGHSMGATSLIYAAHRYPEAFRALVLIEPASAPAHLAWLVKVLPFALLKRFHPVRGAIQKRDRWPSQAEFLKSCERSGLYRRFGPVAMQAILDHLIQEHEDGVELVYPKTWEAYNFSRVCDPIPTLARLKVPVLGIRGEDSFFMDARAWSRFTSTPSMVWHTKIDDFGHLLPLEAPQLCAQTVLEGLQTVRGDTGPSPVISNA